MIKWEHTTPRCSHWPSLLCILSVHLLGRSTSDGFQVASSNRTCGEGLWMWRTPLKRTVLDETNYKLLLLDSEGINAYDQMGTYSTQIFSLAVLLSSMFIYNQMGGIDEASLGCLSFVAQMTKCTPVRAPEKRKASEIGLFSEIFFWLLWWKTEGNVMILQFDGILA